MEELTTEVTKEDIKNGVEDEFGVVYSRDGKRLLDGRNFEVGCYEIKQGTKVICDRAFLNLGLNLRQIKIPDTVTIIGVSAFEWCKGLQQISIPNSVKLIGNSAFIYCSSLRQVTMSNSLTSIGEKSFYQCQSLEKIIIPKSVTIIGDSAFKSCWKLQCIVISNSVTKIGNEAFSDCWVLNKINISDSVMMIGDYAFSYCPSLHQIIIPESVTSIGKNPFVACCDLDITSNSSRFVIDNECLTDNHNVIISYFGEKNSIEIPKTVTTIGDSAFFRCSSLQQISIPDSVTTIGDRAFFRCSSLQQIHIPDSVTTIGDSVFAGCSSLQQIHIPDSVVTIGDSAFWGCSSLQQIHIPDSVMTIGDSAFCGCSSLQQIHIPDSVTTIGDSAFCGCSSLQQIYIPDSVMTIGDSAFYECKALRQISIPNPVTTIGNRTFGYCESLQPTIASDLVSRIRADKLFTPIYIDRIVPEKLRIKKIRMKNYRAFKDEEVYFDDYNCIIGKNDSGKSSIFAALEWFFDVNKELNEKDLNSEDSVFFKKITHIDAKEDDLCYNISVEVYFSGAIIREYLFSNNYFIDEDFIDKDGCVCIKKEVFLSLADLYHRVPKRNMKYAIKTYVFRQMKSKRFSDCSYEDLKQECQKIFIQSDKLWNEIQQFEDGAGRINRDFDWIKRKICDRLYQYFSNSEREEQWMDFDNEHSIPFHLDWLDSYKLLIYTPHTSLNNYLNDLLKIKYSESIEDTKSRMAKDLSKMLADNSVSESIRFAKNETIDLFTNDNLLLCSGNIPLNNRGEGIQLKIKIAVFKILTGIKSESHNTIFAFEEPETHLHPSAQIEMYETIKKLSENPNYQVIITTHSPYIVKQLAKDNINPIVVKRDEKLKVSKISRLDERVLPYVSMNEMNYIAFDEPSIEYHIELFGFIQQKTKKNPGGVDSWLLENKYAKREYDYYQVDANSQLIPDKKGGFQHSDKTLPYCVRNQIDHPNDINKQYENRDYIRRSIDIMRNAILNNPDIFQKKE